jgi:O-antigen/teichoic acid export membrane protein
MAHATVHGTFWTYASYYSGKLLIFITTVILARLLSQDDFGVAGYALVAISFLEVMSDCGVGQALIYFTRTPDTVDTAFWLNIGTSTALFIATLLIAPLTGIYFNDPRAVGVVQALALTFPLSALGNTHDVLLRKDLSFQKKFIPDFAKAFGKGTLSIALAAFGFGPWSLILGQILGRAIAVVVLWWIVPWRPSLRFLPALARKLFGFGMNLVAVDFLGVVLNNADYLLVGRYLGAAALGVYSLAFRIPDLVVMQFCDVISRVIFPVYAKLKEDAHALQKGFFATTRYVSLITIPLGAGIALLARPLVLAAYTDKWADAIPVMQAIAIYSVMLSLAYNAGDVYKAQGRPGVVTLLSLLRLGVLLPALAWAAIVLRSMVAVGWVHAALAFVSGLFELGVACYLLRTSFLSILDALRPAVIAGALMTLSVLGVLILIGDASPWWQIAAGVPAGAAVYLGILWILDRSLIIQSIEILRMALWKGRPRQAG